MRINRLFEMVYLLLDQGKITARELAERFEVSTRTIYRDVEVLSGSGVPVYMTKGHNGGIALLPDFVLNRALLSEEEKQDILSALYSLSALDEKSVDGTLSRMSRFFGGSDTGIFEIDFEDWGSLIRDQFDKAKQAILSRRLLSFDYVSASGSGERRKVEPYKLWFKDKAWYLKAFCLDRMEERVFRFSRMRQAEVLEEAFIPRILSFPEQTREAATCPATEVVLKVGAEMSHRVMDEFPERDVAAEADGSFTVTMRCIEDEWLYGYLLSFGASAVVLRPERIRQIIAGRLQEMMQNYL